jgi:outer membrane protein OmpA-like peptidoglycan-associated protein
MPSTQITAAGKGDAEAIVEENMAMNRRVELKIK